MVKEDNFMTYQSLVDLSILEDDYDLKLYNNGEKEKIKRDEKDWRINSFKVKGNRYWRFESGSRGKRETRYIGTDRKVKELFPDKIAQRKSRGNNFRIK